MPGWIREEHATLSLQECVYLLGVALENNKLELAYSAVDQLLWYYFEGGKPYLVNPRDEKYCPDIAYTFLLSLIKFIGLIDKSSKSHFIKRLTGPNNSFLPDIVQGSIGAKKREPMSDREKILLFMSKLAMPLMLKHPSFKANKNIYHLLHEKYTTESSRSSSLNSTPRTRAKRTTLEAKFASTEWSRNANNIINYGILSNIVHKMRLKISPEKLNLFAVHYDDLVGGMEICNDKHILLQQLENNNLSEENIQYINAVAKKLNGFQPDLMETKKIPDIISLLTVYKQDKALFVLLLEQFYLFLTSPQDYIKQYEPHNYGFPMNIFTLLCELLNSLYNQTDSVEFAWLYELQDQYNNLNAKKEKFSLNLGNVPDYIQQFSQRKVSEIPQYIQGYHQSGDMCSSIEGVFTDQVKNSFEELKRILPSIDTNDPDKDNLQQIKSHYQAVQHTLVMSLPLHYMHRLISFFYNPTDYLFALLVADDELMSELKMAIDDRTMEFKQNVEYGIFSNDEVFSLMQELINPLLTKKLTSLINRECDCFCTMISCFAKESCGDDPKILTNLQNQFMKMLRQLTKSGFFVKLESELGYARQLESLVAQWEKTTLWNMQVGDGLHHLIEQSPKLSSAQRSFSATDLKCLLVSASPRSAFRLVDSDDDDSASVSSRGASSESLVVLSDNASLKAALLRQGSAEEARSPNQQRRPRVYSLPPQLVTQPPWFSDSSLDLQEMLDDPCRAGPSGSN